MKNRVLEMDIPETGKCNLGGNLRVDPLSALLVTVAGFF